MPLPAALAPPSPLYSRAALRFRRSINFSFKPSSSFSTPSIPPISPPSRLLSSSSTPPPTLLQNPHSSTATAAMERCLLVFCGKSTAENRVAESLKEKKLLKLLDRETGEEIETSLVLHCSDGDGHDAVASFRVKSFMDALHSRRFGRLLIWSPMITSTHDLLHQNFGELPVGTICLADAQSKGRGRVKNVWESPAGCLMFSYTVQMNNGRVLPLLQYVVSLAVTEAIKDVCRERDLPILDVKIKWPNDIYLNGLKVAGISCNSTYKSGNFNVLA